MLILIPGDLGHDKLLPFESIILIILFLILLPDRVVTVSLGQNIRVFCIFEKTTKLVWERDSMRLCIQTLSMFF